MSEEDKRIENIRFNFRKLKEAHDWCRNHFKDGIKVNEEDRVILEKLIGSREVPGRIEEVYTDLEKLGVAKEFSAAVFIFGDLWINRFAEGFRNG